MRFGLGEMSIAMLQLSFSCLLHFQQRQYEAFVPHFETGIFQCDSFRFRSFLPAASMADVQLPGERGKNNDSPPCIGVASLLITYIYRWNTRICRFPRWLNGAHLLFEREYQLSRLLSNPSSTNWRNVTIWKCAGTLLEKSRIIWPEKVEKSALRQKRRKQMRFLKSYF